MIGHNVFLIIRILFHPCEILYVRKRRRNDAIVVGQVGELRIDDTVHQGSTFVGAVDLCKQSITLRVELRSQGRRGSYLCVREHAVASHDVLHKGGVLLCHVGAVVGLAHAGLLVSADGEAENFSGSHCEGWRLAGAGEG